MLNNPFLITSDYISDAYFCDREYETKIMVDNIRNNRNTALISPRRMGKSGLIGHVFAQQNIQSQYKTFSVDLYATSSLAEMIMLLSKEIVNEFQSRGERIRDAFISIVKSLRPGLKMDAVSGEIKFDLSLGEIMQPIDSLKEIINYLESSPIPCIVAIDEFQQVTEYPEQNVVALIRTYVQKCKQTSFIFAGSKRRMMEQLFTSPSEPFFQSCVTLYLDVIQRDKYFEFASGHFSAASKIITKPCFDTLYDKVEGHTWYVQRIMNQLFSYISPGEVAEDYMVQDVVNYIVKLESRSYEEHFNRISSSQKQLLLALAKEGKAEEITSVAFVHKHALKSPSTVQSASRNLINNETITKNGSTYSITNRFFSLWIKEHYGL